MEDREPLQDNSINHDKDDVTTPRQRRFATRPRRQRAPNTLKVAQDKAVILYLARWTKPDGTLSKSTMEQTYYAAVHFLQFLNKEITDHAIFDLVQNKKYNPHDTTIEDALALYITLPKASVHRRHASSVLGIFHKNHARLDMTIHISSDHKTQPISEPILLAIRDDPELTQQHRNAIDLMSYGAERVKALSRLPLENVQFIEGTKTALLDIPSNLSKTHTRHPSFLPQPLAEQLLERAKAKGYNCLIPNHRSLWRTITQLATRKYSVRLTSHYFRKRFETIAERIPADKMNPNHWIILMGSAPKLGHMPEVYSLTTDKEIAQEYETYLAPRLSLTDEQKPATPTLESRIKELTKERDELKEQVIKLTKLLTDKLPAQ